MSGLYSYISKKVIVSIVTRVASKYLNGVDSESFRYNLSKGEISLVDISIKEEALAKLNIPVSVQSVSVRSVQISVPMSNILSGAWNIALNGITVRAKPAESVRPFPATADEAASRRFSTLDTCNDFFNLKKKLNSTMNGDLGITDTVIRNIQMQLTDITVFFTHHTGETAPPLVLHIKSLAVFSTDGDWAAVESPSSEAMFRKRLLLWGLTLSTGTSYNEDAAPDLLSLSEIDFRALVSTHSQAFEMNLTILLGTIRSNIQKSYLSPPPCVKSSSCGTCPNCLNDVCLLTALQRSIRRVSQRIPRPSRVGSWYRNMWVYAIRCVVFESHRRLSIGNKSESYHMVNAKAAVCNEYRRLKTAQERKERLTGRQLRLLNEYEYHLPLPVLNREWGLMLNELSGEPGWWGGTRYPQLSSYATSVTMKPADEEEEQLVVKLKDGDKELSAFVVASVKSEVYHCTGDIEGGRIKEVSFIDDENMQFVKIDIFRNQLRCRIGGESLQCINEARLDSEGRLVISTTGRTCTVPWKSRPLVFARLRWLCLQNSIDHNLPTDDLTSQLSVGAVSLKCGDVTVLSIPAGPTSITYTREVRQRQCSKTCRVPKVSQQISLTVSHRVLFKIHFPLIYLFSRLLPSPIPKLFPDISDDWKALPVAGFPCDYPFRSIGCNVEPPNLLVSNVPPRLRIVEGRYVPLGRRNGYPVWHSVCGDMCGACEVCEAARIYTTMSGRWMVGPPKGIGKSVGWMLTEVTHGGVFPHEKEVVWMEADNVKWVYTDTVITQDIQEVEHVEEGSEAYSHGVLDSSDYSSYHEDEVFDDDASVASDTSRITRQVHSGLEQDMLPSHVKPRKDPYRVSGNSESSPLTVQTPDGQLDTVKFFTRPVGSGIGDVITMARQGNEMEVTCNGRLLPTPGILRVVLGGSPRIDLLRYVSSKTKKNARTTELVPGGRLTLPHTNLPILLGQIRHIAEQSIIRHSVPNEIQAVPTHILNYPCGVACDSHGVLYIADTDNHRVLQWIPGCCSGWLVAGGNGSGSAMRQLNKPGGLCLVEAKEKKYLFIADTNNHRVQRWDVDDKDVEPITVAGGNGAGHDKKHLKYPSDVSIGPDGMVYVCDTGNHRVQRWAVGSTHANATVAGSKYCVSGPDLNLLHSPKGICVTYDSTLYVADTYNHRVIHWQYGADSGKLAAGSGNKGCLAHELSFPEAVAATSDSSLVIADTGNNRVQYWESAVGTGSTIQYDMNSPADICLSKQDEIYVSETQHNVVYLCTSPAFTINIKNVEDEWGELSPDYPEPFTFRGREFSVISDLFPLCYTNDILTGRKVNEEMLIESLTSAFLQRSRTRRILKATGTRPIRNHDVDSFWGTGLDGLGANVYGKALKKVRKNLESPPVSMGLLLHQGVEFHLPLCRPSTVKKTWVAVFKAEEIRIPGGLVARLDRPLKALPVTETSSHIHIDVSSGMFRIQPFGADGLPLTTADILRDVASGEDIRCFGTSQYRGVPVDPLASSTISEAIGEVAMAYNAPILGCCDISLELSTTFASNDPAAYWFAVSCGVFPVIGCDAVPININPKAGVLLSHLYKEVIELAANPLRRQSNASYRSEIGSWEVSAPTLVIQGRGDQNRSPRYQWAKHTLVVETEPFSINDRWVLRMYREDGDRTSWPCGSGNQEFRSRHGEVAMDPCAIVVLTSGLELPDAPLQMEVPVLDELPALEKAMSQLQKLAHPMGADSGVKEDRNELWEKYCIPEVSLVDDKLYDLLGEQAVSVLHNLLDVSLPPSPKKAMTMILNINSNLLPLYKTYYAIAWSVDGGIEGSAALKGGDRVKVRDSDADCWQFGEVSEVIDGKTYVILSNELVPKVWKHIERNGEEVKCAMRHRSLPEVKKLLSVMKEKILDTNSRVRQFGSTSWQHPHTVPARQNRPSKHGRLDSEGFPKPAFFKSHAYLTTPRLELKVCDASYSTIWILQVKGWWFENGSTFYDKIGDMGLKECKIWERKEEVGWEEGIRREMLQASRLPENDSLSDSVSIQSCLSDGDMEGYWELRKQWVALGDGVAQAEFNRNTLFSHPSPMHVFHPFCHLSSTTEAHDRRMPPAHPPKGGWRGNFTPTASEVNQPWLHDAKSLSAPLGFYTSVVMSTSDRSLWCTQKGMTSLAVHGCVGNVRFFLDRTVLPQTIASLMEWADPILGVPEIINAFAWPCYEPVFPNSAPLSKVTFFDFKVESVCTNLQVSEEGGPAKPLFKVLVSPPGAWFRVKTTPVDTRFDCKIGKVEVKSIDTRPEFYVSRFNTVLSVSSSKQWALEMSYVCRLNEDVVRLWGYIGSVHLTYSAKTIRQLCNFFPVKTVQYLPVQYVVDRYGCQIVDRDLYDEPDDRRRVEGGMVLFPCSAYYSLENWKAKRMQAKVHPGDLLYSRWDVDVVITDVTVLVPYRTLEVDQCRSALRLIMNGLVLTGSAAGGSLMGPTGSNACIMIEFIEDAELDIGSVMSEGIQFAIKLEKCFEDKSTSLNIVLFQSSMMLAPEYIQRVSLITESISDDTTDILLQDTYVDCDEIQIEPVSYADVTSDLSLTLIVTGGDFNITLLSEASRGRMPVCEVLMTNLSIEMLMMNNKLSVRLMQPRVKVVTTITSAAPPLLYNWQGMEEDDITGRDNLVYFEYLLEDSPSVNVRYNIEVDIKPMSANLSMDFVSALMRVTSASRVDPQMLPAMSARSEEDVVVRQEDLEHIGNDSFTWNVKEPEITLSGGRGKRWVIAPHSTECQRNAEVHIEPAHFLVINLNMDPDQYRKWRRSSTVDGSSSHTYTDWVHPIVLQDFTNVVFHSTHFKVRFPFQRSTMQYATIPLSQYFNIPKSSSVSFGKNCTVSTVNTFNQVMNPDEGASVSNLRLKRMKMSPPKSAGMPLVRDGISVKFLNSKTRISLEGSGREGRLFTITVSDSFEALIPKRGETKIEMGLAELSVKGGWKYSETVCVFQGCDKNPLPGTKYCKDHTVGKNLLHVHPMNIVMGREWKDNLQKFVGSFRITGSLNAMGPENNWAELRLTVGDVLDLRDIIKDFYKVIIPNIEPDDVVESLATPQVSMRGRNMKPFSMEVLGNFNKLSFVLLDDLSGFELEVIRSRCDSINIAGIVTLPMTQSCDISISDIEAHIDTTYAGAVECHNIQSGHWDMMLDLGMKMSLLRQQKNSRLGYKTVITMEPWRKVGDPNDAGDTISMTVSTQTLLGVVEILRRFDKTEAKKIRQRVVHTAGYTVCNEMCLPLIVVLKYGDEMRLSALYQSYAHLTHDAVGGKRSITIAAAFTTNRPCAVTHSRSNRIVLTPSSFGILSIVQRCCRAPLPKCVIQTAVQEGRLKTTVRSSVLLRNDCDFPLAVRLHHPALSEVRKIAETCGSPEIADPLIIVPPTTSFLNNVVALPLLFITKGASLDVRPLPSALADADGEVWREKIIASDMQGMQSRDRKELECVTWSSPISPVQSTKGIPIYFLNKAHAWRGDQGAANKRIPVQCTITSHPIPTGEQQAKLSRHGLANGCFLSAVYKPMWSYNAVPTTNVEEELSAMDLQIIIRPTAKFVNLLPVPIRYTIGAGSNTSKIPEVQHVIDCLTPHLKDGCEAWSFEVEFAIKELLESETAVLVEPVLREAGWGVDHKFEHPPDKSVVSDLIRDIANATDPQVVQPGKSAFLLGVSSGIDVKISFAMLTKNEQRSHPIAIPHSVVTVGYDIPCYFKEVQGQSTTKLFLTHSSLDVDTELTLWAPLWILNQMSLETCKRLHLKKYSKFTACLRRDTDMFVSKDGYGAVRGEPVMYTPSEDEFTERTKVSIDEGTNSSVFTCGELGHRSVVCSVERAGSRKCVPISVTTVTAPAVFCKTRIVTFTDQFVACNKSAKHIELSVCDYKDSLVTSVPSNAKHPVQWGSTKHGVSFSSSSPPFLQVRLKGSQVWSPKFCPTIVSGRVKVYCDEENIFNLHPQLYGPQNEFVCCLNVNCSVESFVSFIEFSTSWIDELETTQPVRVRLAYGEHEVVAQVDVTKLSESEDCIKYISIQHDCPFDIKVRLAKRSICLVIIPGHQTCRFHVRVVQAEDLIGRDRKICGENTSDPYCTLRLDGKVPLYGSHKTDVIRNNVNPVWGDGDWKTFGIRGSDGVLIVTLWDSDVLTDDFLGQVIIQVSEAKLGKTGRKRFELQARPGSADWALVRAHGKEDFGCVYLEWIFREPDEPLQAIEEPPMEVPVAAEEYPLIIDSSVSLNLSICGEVGGILREIIFVDIGGVDFVVIKEDDGYYSGRLTIKTFQIDNSMGHADFPVILGALDRKESRPFMQLSLAKAYYKSHVLQIGYMGVFLQPMKLTLGDADVLSLFMGFSQVLNVLASRKVGQKRLSNIINREPQPPGGETNHVYLRLGELLVHKIKPEITWLGVLGGTSDVMPFMQSWGLSLFSVDEAQVKLPEFRAANLMIRRKELTTILIRHYLPSILKSSVVVLGASTVGNPSKVLSSLSKGVANMAAEITKGLSAASLGGFGKGVVKGAVALLAQVITALLVLVAAVCTLVSRLLGVIDAVGGDEKYQRRHRIHLRVRAPRGFTHGFREGFTRLCFGMGLGISGLVVKPYYGGKKRGVVGFGKGTVCGVIGVVTKPPQGVFELVSAVCNGCIAHINGPQSSLRRRHPRVIMDGVLSPYNRTCSEVYHMLCQLNILHNTGERLGTEYYVHHSEGIFPNTYYVISTHRVCQISKGRVLNMDWNARLVAIGRASAQANSIILHRSGSGVASWNTKRLQLPDREAVSEFLAALTKISKIQTEDLDAIRHLNDSLHYHWPSFNRATEVSIPTSIHTHTHGANTASLIAQNKDGLSLLEYLRRSMEHLASS